MKRPLLNLLTIGSILLCVVTAVFWARSHQVHERFYFRRPVPTHKLAEGEGPFVQFDQGVAEVGWVRWEKYMQLPPAWDEPMGLHRITGPPGGPWGRKAFEVPAIYSVDSAPEKLVSRLGLSRRRGVKATQPLLAVHYNSATFPLWPVVAATAAIPLVRATGAWKRYRRRRRGLCPDCGYDLRATLGRCPECGPM